MKTIGVLTLMMAALWVGCASEPDPYDQLFEDSFVLPEIVITAPASRGDLNAAPLELGIDEYKNGKFERALTGFNEFLESNPEYLEVMYYRGLTLLKLEKREDAVKDFEVVATSESEYREQAEWYLALSYIKLRQKDKAVELLKSMKKNSQTQADKATHLLSKIDQWPS